MACIAVDQLEPGMVLSEDVLDVNTRLLLSKGQKIIPKHIRVLKIWGVNEVNIVGDAKDVIKIIPPSDPGKESRVKEAVDIVFSHLNHGHPILNEIRRVSLTYRLQEDVPMCPMSTPQPLRADGSLDRPKNVGRHIQKIDAKLPEAPFIITELNNVIADDHSTSNDVAQVVNKSPSLSAVILKIVNSAFYGFPSKIDRISRAVTIIGTKQISSVALGICVMQAFKDIPKEFLDTKAFLRHSLACGLVARVIGAFKNMADTEQLFVSGLLHDIGKLILFKYYPDHAREAINLAITSGSSVYETEKRTVGLNHTQIGRHLIRKWRLPTELEANIVFHHTPSRSPDPIKSGIIQLADLIAHGLGIGGSGEKSVPCADTTVLDQIGISANAVHLVARQATQQLMPLEVIFEG